MQTEVADVWTFDDDVAYEEEEEFDDADLAGLAGAESYFKYGQSVPGAPAFAPLPPPVEDGDDSKVGRKDDSVFSLRAGPPPSAGSQAPPPLSGGQRSSAGGGSSAESPGPPQSPPPLPKHASLESVYREEPLSAVVADAASHSPSMPGTPAAAEMLQLEEEEQKFSESPSPEAERFYHSLKDAGQKVADDIADRKERKKEREEKGLLDMKDLTTQSTIKTLDRIASLDTAEKEIELPKPRTPTPPPRTPTPEPEPEPEPSEPSSPEPPFEDEAPPAKVEEEAPPPPKVKKEKPPPPKPVTPPAKLNPDVAAAMAMRNLAAELKMAGGEVKKGDIKQAVLRLTRLFEEGLTENIIAEAAKEDASTGRVAQRDYEDRAKRRKPIIGDVLINARFERGQLLRSIHLWALALTDLTAGIDALKEKAGDRDAETLLHKFYLARAALNRSMENYDASIADYTQVMPKPHGKASGRLALYQEELGDALEARGETFIKANRLDEALKEFQQITQEYKNRAGAWLKLSEVQQLKADKGALDSLAQASLLKPGDEKLAGQVSDAMEKDGDPKRGINHLGLILKKGAQPVALLKRAKMRIQVAATEVEDDPKSGETAEKQREAMYTGAAEDLSNLISMDKLNAEGLLLRGCLEANSKKYAKRGMEDLATVIELSPTDPRPHLARALSYENQGVAVEAIAEYIEAARKSKKEGAFAYVAAALVYAQFLGDDVTAIFYCTRALHRDVSCVRAYVVRADCFFRSGDYARALSDMGRALQHAPNNPIHRAMHARYLLACGRVKLASADCWSLAQLPLESADADALGAAASDSAGRQRSPYHPGRRQTRCGSCRTGKAASRGLLASSSSSSQQAVPAGGSSDGFDEATTEVIEMMAECALLIGKPRDAAALLEQLDKDSGADKKPPPVGSQQPADGGGSPLRLPLSGSVANAVSS